MPHRSPGLLNPLEESVGGPSFAKYKISFRQTFRQIFDSKILEPSPPSKGLPPERPIKLLHSLYLELMALYDLEFFTETAIPELLLNADSGSELGLELLLLGLTQAAKVLDPSKDFRQKYMTVHGQISEVFQSPAYAHDQARQLNRLSGLKNLVESAFILLVQSPLFCGQIVEDTLDFFKSSQYKDLCSDSLGVVWPSPSLSVAKESEYVAKFLAQTGQA